MRLFFFILISFALMRCTSTRSLVAPLETKAFYSKFTDEESGGRGIRFYIEVSPLDTTLVRIQSLFINDIFLDFSVHPEEKGVGIRSARIYETNGKGFDPVPGEASKTLYFHPAFTAMMILENRETGQTDTLYIPDFEEQEIPGR